MTRGVLYWMLGTRHAEHLAISLYSLRKRYQGPIAIAVGDAKAKEFCELLGDADVQLIDYDHERFTPRKRGSTYLSKTLIHKVSPFDQTLLLDADTLVTGSIDELWPESDEVVLTQFCDWQTTGRPVKGRVEGWKPFAPKEVARMLSQPHPAINTGVMAWTKQSTKFLDAWYEMTARNVCFMCDELAAQLIYPDYRVRLMDERWNGSPIHSWARYGVPASAFDGMASYHVDHNGQPERVIPDSTILQMSTVYRDEKRAKSTDVHIWHGHGFKFIKRAQGRAIWWPYLSKAINSKWCGMSEWCPYNKTRWPKCQFVQYLNDPTKFN